MRNILCFTSVSHRANACVHSRGQRPAHSTVTVRYSVWHAPPQVWDLKDLGMQAAQRILDSGEPLRLLTELAGSFPAHAGPLSRLEVAPEKRTEWAVNRRILQVKLHCTYVLVS